MPKHKHWRGMLTVVKKDFKTTNGYHFVKGQVLTDEWIVTRIRMDIESQHPKQPRDVINQYLDDVVQEVSNFHFQTAMKFEHYSSYRSNPHFFAKDLNDPRLTYDFSLGNFWDVVPHLVNGEISGTFSRCKKGSMISTRLITDPDELKAIANGNW